MTAPDGIKIPALVGVIASKEEIRAASRMRTRPDLFEVRLDYLPTLDPSEISELRRPVIVTARHPREGGKKISARKHASASRCRRDLLLKFLPHARFVDVELRSLRELRDVWEEAAKMKRICSVHDFARTPGLAHLRNQYHRAQDAGAGVFKLVTRADTPDDFLTLLQFLRMARAPCCVMAIGKFGALSRVVFPECGSVFVYAALRRPLHPGQLMLRQLLLSRGVARGKGKRLTSNVEF